MVIVCLLFLLLSFVGSAIDLSIMIFRWLMETAEISQRFSRTGSDSGDSVAEDTPLSTQANTLLPSTKNVNKMFSSFEKPLEFITAFSIFKNLEMIISTKQPPNAITCFNGIRVISMSWIILGHVLYFQIDSYVLKNVGSTMNHSFPSSQL